MVVAAQLPDLYRRPQKEEVYREPGENRFTPWATIVRDMTLTFYLHQRSLTKEPGDGVIEVTARMMIAKAKTRAVFWEIDCVDWGEPLDHWGRTDRERAELEAIKTYILRAFIAKIVNLGIRPDRVKGWSRWLRSFQLREHL